MQGQQTSSVFLYCSACACSFTLPIKLTLAQPLSFLFLLPLEFSPPSLWEGGTECLGGAWLPTGVNPPECFLAPNVGPVVLKITTDLIYKLPDL